MRVDLLPGLTDEQEMLLDATTRFIDAELPMDAVRARADGGGGPGPGYLRAAGELGWFGMLAAESHGGGSASANGLVDAALIAAERGARLQPGPFAGHNVVVHALSLALAGSSGAQGEQLDALAELIEGRRWATWIADGPLVGADGQRIELVDVDGGHRLDGRAEVVADAADCAWLLVTASGPDGPTQVLLPAGAPGVSLRRLDGLDVTRRWAAVELDGIDVPAGAVVGTPGAPTATLVDHQLHIASVLSAAEAVGAMDADFRLALDYAKARIAFGRPIGSFQAIKHLLADTSLWLEMAKGVVAAAAQAVGRGAPNGPELAHAAKSFVGDRSVELAHSCFQVFGGIGFTWEHDQHLFLRRLAAEAAALGPPSWHRRRLWDAARATDDPSQALDIPAERGPTSPEPEGDGDLVAWQARARAWLEANLERRTGEATRSPLFGGGEDRSPEALAPERRLQRKLHEAGYAGITWPREYGGQGLPPEYQRAFDEEARHFVLPDLGVPGGATFGVCAPTMLAHASPDFLRRNVPRILAGDALVAQFFSDPEAGSDLAGVRTQAVRDGDRWILNGSKIWSSGAWYADYGMCLARTDWDVPKHRGLTWFLVPTTAEGVTVQRIRQINGDAEFCQEFFDDVELSDDDVIGPVNGGWAVTQTMLLFERGGGGNGIGSTAAQSPGGGIAPDLVELAAHDPGRLDDPVVRDLIARAHVDDVVRKAFLVRLVALMRTNPALAGNLASYGKLASGTFDPIRANLAMQIGGRAAIAWDPNGGDDPPGARTATGLLNSRFLAIAGGTNEVQRNSVGERVLGLPREPAFDTRKPFRDVLRDAQSWSGQVS